MKKWIRWYALCCLCMVALMSCGKKQAEEGVVSSKLSGEIAETIDGYYICDFDTIRFYDKKTGEIVPVCSKPECSHTEAGECNSIITNYKEGISIQSGIQIYNNKLYYIVKNGSRLCLNREDLDGTNHEEVTVLVESYNDNDATFDFQISNDSIYMTMWDLETDEKEVASLRTKKITEAGPMKTVYTVTTTGDDGSYISDKCFQDGTVYFVNEHYNYKPCEACGENRICTHFRIYGDIYRYNPESEVLEEVFEEEAGYGLSIQGEYVYYINEKGEVRRGNLDTLESELLLTLDEEDSRAVMFSDEKYLYFDNYPSQNLFGTKDHKILVYDLDGNKVDTITGLEGDSINCDSESVVGWDADNIRLFNKSQIGTEDRTVKEIKLKEYVEEEA